ncbi:hypothetical protein B5K11_05745 [Rhizobium leguminosarum bv. trifolii]|nr:hypothetical protein B5K11_05745 [Rhizobium leguminosarum bv. trifolii]
MSGNGLWSALQTHLQGVDGTTLAIKPEIILHGVILLSRKGCKIEIPLPGVGGKGCAVARRPRKPHPEVPRRGLEGRGGCTGGWTQGAALERVLRGSDLWPTRLK